MGHSLRHKTVHLFKKQKTKKPQKAIRSESCGNEIVIYPVSPV